MRRRVSRNRRLPIGAEVVGPDGVHFRVWAPKRQRVRVVLEQQSGPAAIAELEAEAGGYFSRVVPQVRAGALYRFRLDDDDYLYPDPASRFQPEGPHGPSQVIDPAAFTWSDGGWGGVELP